MIPDIMTQSMRNAATWDEATADLTPTQRELARRLSACSFATGADAARFIREESWRTDAVLEAVIVAAERGESATGILEVDDLVQMWRLLDGKPL